MNAGCGEQKVLKGCDLPILEILLLASELRPGKS